MNRIRKATAVLACGVALGASSNAPAQCLVALTRTFQLPGVGYTARASASFNDGNGPALYVGGTFRVAGGVRADYIAKWTGTQWEAVGGGVGQSVKALIVHDDGSGPALFVGGAFTTVGGAGGAPALRVAKWNGAAWSNVGDGFAEGAVDAFAVFDDDGPGPRPAALYAAGSFLFSGTTQVDRIARWNGATWEPVGGGIHGNDISEVFALTVIDEDEGGPNLPTLVAAGRFATAGETPASNVARWNGAIWSSIGSGVNGPVFAAAAFNRGTGMNLYLGGSFSRAGTVIAHNVARWTGTTWTSLGNGLDSYVWCMHVHDPDGAGAAPTELYIGGVIIIASGVYVSHLTRWTGLNYLTVGGGMSAAVWSMTTHDDGQGPGFVATGDFDQAGNTGASGVAMWRGGRWSAFGAGVSEQVRDLQPFDDGRGPAVFAATTVAHDDGTTSQGVVRWDGDDWTDVGLPPNGRFHYATGLAAGAVPGSGPASLYAGGYFEHPDGVREHLVAQWDGHTWLPIGRTPTGFIYDVITADISDERVVVAAGSFAAVDQVSATRIARWNGVTWNPFGSGFDAYVNALAMHDDGGGSTLYAGGDFLNSGARPISRIAKWTGSEWTNLAEGLNAAVLSMTTYVDPIEGRLLIVGVESSPAIRAWNGVSWRSLPSGGDPHSLYVFDRDGNGPEAPALISGGWRYTGSGWIRYATISAGQELSIDALAEFDTDGAGPNPPLLLVGGEFSLINQIPSGKFAAITLDGPAPVLDDLPSEVRVDVGDYFTLRAEHDEAPPIGYQWRKNGLSLPYADSQTLQSFIRQYDDHGVYDVVVTSLCGSTISSPVNVIVRCPADWNRSDFIDTQDFFDFLTAFFAGEADFNRDDDTNTLDFFEFLAVFLNGCV